MKHLVPMTEEQREQIKQKRIADQEYAKANLKLDYADSGYWSEIASKYKLTMPHWYIPASATKYIRRACKKTGVDMDKFIESTGFSNLNQFVNANPTWTAVATVGLVLEFAENKGDDN